MSRRQAKRILISGSGPIADALLDGLRRSGRPADRLEDRRWPARAVRGASAVLLAPSEGPANARLRELVGPHDPGFRDPSAIRVIQVLAGSPSSALQRAGSAVMPLETLDLPKEFSRDMLVRHPLHRGIDPSFGQIPHLLFAGDATPADALALQAMRLAHYGSGAAVFTFASTDPDTRRRDIGAICGEANRFCRLRFSALVSPNLNGQPPVTTVFVCLPDPEEGLRTARRLAGWIGRCQGVSPEIHLEIGAAESCGGISEWEGQIYPFSWLREACRPEVWLDGRGDGLARVVHDHYRDSIAAQGRDPETEPAGRRWEDLSASYRDANRYQADHLSAKLAVTDCRAVPEDQVESFAFAPLEVERLAVIEHDRWAADRYLAGWSFGVTRDDARRHHPQLVPYEDLSEPMKDLDRFAVRLVPVLLARSGQGLVRLLIVGLADSDAGAPPGRVLARLGERLLTRLRLRYPDRSLVLASTLSQVSARVIVRQALERFSAGLFLLCPHPIGDMLSSQPDPRSRRDFLDLAARAERRISLSQGETLPDWFARRAEIMLLFGSPRGEFVTSKQVHLNESAAALTWNFEY